MLPNLPIYCEIVERVKSGATLIDVGCYLGTDLRRLAIDGCPQKNLSGVDLIDHWDLGFELYRDQDNFNATFYQGDILDPNEGMRALFGKVDVICATHLLHNWDWATQVNACCNLVAFSREGSIVVGFQVGTMDPKQAMWERANEGAGPHALVLHTVETFENLWDEVGVKTGTKWKSEAVVRGWEDCGYRRADTAYLGEQAGFLQFVVSRLS